MDVGSEGSDTGGREEGEGCCWGGDWDLGDGGVCLSCLSCWICCCIVSCAERKCSIAFTKSPLQPCSTSSSTVRFWLGKMRSRISRWLRRPGRNPDGTDVWWARGGGA